MLIIKVELLVLKVIIKELIMFIRLFRNIRFDFKILLHIFYNNLQIIYLIIKIRKRINIKLQYVNI